MATPQPVPAEQSGMVCAGAKAETFSSGLPLLDSENRFLAGTVVGDGDFQKLAAFTFFQCQLSGALVRAAIRPDTGKKGGNFVLAFRQVGNKQLLNTATFQRVALLVGIEMR